MPDLSLKTLQHATLERIAHFKNAQGALSYTREDGTDWSPADWLAAMLGEVGEFARERHLYETGQLNQATYAKLAPKELADIQTYLATVATRALDVTQPRNSFDRGSPSETLQEVVANLGEWANLNKKRLRGDLSAELQRAAGGPLLDRAIELLQALRDDPFMLPSEPVTSADPNGVDLGEVTQAKFNEVSARIGAPLQIQDGQLIRNA